MHIPPQETRARLRAQLIADEIGQAVDLALVEADISYLLAADPELRHALNQGTNPGGNPMTTTTHHRCEAW